MKLSTQPCWVLGNTKGSWNYMPKIFKARKSQKLILSDRQFDIIVGSLFGDSYVSVLGKIQFEHSKKAKRYLEWKFQELEEIRYKRIGYVKRKGISGNDLSSYRFWTRQFFRPLRNLIYRDGKKYLPPAFLKMLTPLAMAIWYMDDGHYEYLKKRCIIATDGFSNEDRENLKCFLKEKFGFEIVIRKSGKIAMSQKETEKFLNIIAPYRLDCMAYKFLNPLTTKAITQR